MLPILLLTPANIVQCLFIFLGTLGSSLLYYQPRYKGVMCVLIYFAVLMSFNLLEELGITKAFLFITPAFTLLLGPIFYLMVNDLVNAPQITFKSKIKHSLPALISVFFTQHTEVVIALGAISQLVYLFAWYKLLRRYELATVNSSSDADSQQLHWLGKGCFAMVLFLLVDMLRLNIRPLITNETYYLWYIVDLVILLFICCYLLIMSVKQPELFNELKEFEQNVSSKCELETNISKTTNEEDLVKANEMFTRLDKLIDSSQLYKTPKLTVQQVAQQTGLTAKETSWLINEIAGQNFNDYINTKRIKAIKDQLSSQTIKSNSILDIALECGFNSKSTFNLAFKKLEGSTPSQYAKDCLIKGDYRKG